ncbi:MAG: hypothetical protein HY687_01760 [Chloroflexi bacterium]|nr:hypothetical protein [Chloroflexota bacterium]
MRRSIILALTMALLLAPRALAADPPGKAIRGQVVNLTAGAGPVAGQKVTLKTTRGSAAAGQVDTTTDAAGKFQFQGLTGAAGEHYQVTLNYQTVDYSSDIVVFAEGEAEQSLEMAVYETTPSGAGVVVPEHMTLVQVAAGTVLVEEYFQFRNNSDRAYVGSKVVDSDGRMETLRFPMPAGAFQLTYTMGFMDCCVKPSPDGFLDTMAVTPEVKDLGYSYMLAYSGDSVSLTKTVEYPVADYSFLVEGTGYRISSPGLKEEPPVTFGNVQYLRLSGQNLKPGETFTVRLGGLPQAGLQGTLLWAGAGLAVVAGALALTYPLLRRRRLAPAPALAGDERRRLLLEIARLDDRYEAGAIPEKEYRRRRAQAKAGLQGRGRPAP